MEPTKTSKRGRKPSAKNRVPSTAVKQLLGSKINFESSDDETYIKPPQKLTKTAIEKQQELINELNNIDIDKIKQNDTFAENYLSGHCEINLNVSTKKDDKTVGLLDDTRSIISVQSQAKTDSLRFSFVEKPVLKSMVITKESGVIPKGLKCWWCKNDFSTEVCFLPTNYDPFRKRYSYMGYFCSWRCSKAFNHEINDNKIFYREHLLKQLCKELGITSVVKAPHWTLLKEYGGSLTIEEFRKYDKLLREDINIDKNLQETSPNFTILHNRK